MQYGGNRCISLFMNCFCCRSSNEVKLWRFVKFSWSLTNKRTDLTHTNTHKLDTVSYVALMHTRTKLDYLLNLSQSTCTTKLQFNVVHAHAFLCRSPMRGPRLYQLTTITIVGRLYTVIEFQWVKYFRMDACYNKSSAEHIPRALLAM